jgi:hypothetical protein
VVPVLIEVVRLFVKLTQLLLKFLVFSSET